jgi:hypothetical protein
MELGRMRIVLEDITVVVAVGARDGKETDTEVSTVDMVLDTSCAVDIADPELLRARNNQYRQIGGEDNLRVVKQRR